MNIKLAAVIMLVSLMDTGCLFDPDNLSRIDFVKLDKPVMLGTVRKIGGAPINYGAKKQDLDYSHYTSNVQIQVSWITHDRFDIYDDLKKNGIAPDDLIKVDSVYFGSSFFLFIPYSSCRTTTGVEGGVYEGARAGQTRGRMTKTESPGGKP